MSEFPTQSGELTTEWLTSVFHESGHLGNDRVIAAFEAETIGEGKSLLGLVQRVTLTTGPGDGPAAPDSVVIKFAHPLEANRAIAMNTRMYEREIDFFENIAPHVDMRLTEYYHGSINLETGQNAVVIEDLHTYRAGDQVTATADYDVAVLWIMAYPLIIGGAFDPANERGLALAQTVLQRSTQTVTDRALLSILEGTS